MLRLALGSPQQMHGRGRVDAMLIPIPNFTVIAMCSLKRKEKGRDGKSENNEEPGRQRAPARHQVGFAFPLDEAVAHAAHPAFSRKTAASN